MENLATESFSYSWLTAQKPPPSDNLRRRINDDDDDFHFHVAPSPSHLVNADEIFSEGQIMAVYADRSSAAGPASVPSSPLSGPFRRNHRYYGRWRRSSKKMLLKLLGFVGCSRRKSSSRVHHDVERKVLEARSAEASPTRLGLGFGGGDGYCMKIDENYWRNVDGIRPSRSSSYACCDADENSIREAILHCKRSSI